MQQEKAYRLTRNLTEARERLRSSASKNPALNSAVRALGRVIQSVNRPFRIAILGESNSGKSSIANAILGDVTLPALPVANTRLPTLLRYAETSCVEAVRKSGDKFQLSPQSRLEQGEIVRLDVGLPVAALRSFEIIDFPGSSNPFLRMDVATVLMHRVDAAVWATVATQAWRETERATWTSLPDYIKKRGVLAVTHRDLITSEDNFKKLCLRLNPVAKTYFSAMSFLAMPVKKSPSAPMSSGENRDGPQELLTQLNNLKDVFEAQKLEKALAITHKIAHRALARIEAR